MSQEVADSVRGKGLVVAVSDAYRLAPWADALVSTDRIWWGYHVDALKFAGRKFNAQEAIGVEHVYNVANNINSGLLATRVAVMLGAKSVVLLGIDLQGSHFFGDHPKPLSNTSSKQFDAMKRCFAQYKPEGVEIVNCSPSSALDVYPRGDLAAWI